MNLIVKVVRNRANNLLFLLIRGPNINEWAIKVVPHHNRRVRRILTTAATH
jgi:hypothetical protein